MDDAVFMAMNDVAFPVERVLDGIAAAAEAGLTPIKINMVVKRGVNDGSILDMARHFKGAGTSSGSSSTWTWAPRTAGGSTMWSRPGTSSRCWTAEFGIEPVRPFLPGRSGAAVALPRRSRGGGCHRLGDPAILW